MHRFFVPSEKVTTRHVVLDGAVAHQVCRVLRMRPGERITLLDDSGWEFDTELQHVEPDRVEGRVLKKQVARGEPRTKVSLYQGVLKADHFEFVLQKATELGVVEFVPLITARTVIARMEDTQKKRARWERIVREAAEQSGRGHLPRLREPMLFASACAHAQQMGGFSVLPWEETPAGGGRSIRQVLRQAHPFSVNLFVGPEEGLTPQESQLAQGYRVGLVNLFVGPEGGFTQEEADLARKHGIPAVTLGSRVLRAETAAITVVAVILHEMGDLE
ncbi:MAG: RsmE family RNA methyltransferase [Chloroflexota bacterium]